MLDMTTDKTSTERLALRLRPEDKALLEQAAAHHGEGVSTFVRRAALAEARRTVKGAK